MKAFNNSDHSNAIRYFVRFDRQPLFKTYRLKGCILHCKPLEALQVISVGGGINLCGNLVLICTAKEICQSQFFAESSESAQPKCREFHSERLMLLLSPYGFSFKSKTSTRIGFKLQVCFCTFLLEFANRAMLHDVSENGENICLPSTPVQDEGCLLDYLRSPQNRTSQYFSGSRYRIPFSGYDRGNTAPDSVRRNLVGKLSSPELFRGSVSKQDNRQHIISLNAKQSRSLIKRADGPPLAICCQNKCLRQNYYRKSLICWQSPSIQNTVSDYGCANSTRKHSRLTRNAADLGD